MIQLLLSAVLIAVPAASPGGAAAVSTAGNATESIGGYAAGAGAGAEEGDDPRAPDGHRGLGEATRKNDLYKVFRSPGDADQALLARLADLGRLVRVHAAIAEGSYRARGYFDLMGDVAGQDLEELHAAFRSLARDPGTIARSGGPRGRALARMLLDTRLRARMELLESWAEEAAELRRGLDLLRCAANSFGMLTDAEAASAARRIDMSAALLRAMDLDLAALREDPSFSGPPDEEVDAWLALWREPDSTRSAKLQAAASSQLARAFAMQAALGSTALRDRMEELLSWRRDAQTAASLALHDALRYLPDSPEGQDVSPEILRMKVTERRQRARQTALDALDASPLDEGLTLVAARASRVIEGVIEAASLYDRYLSLRGIRYQDDRTWPKGRMSKDEEEALWFVDQYAKGELANPEEPPPSPPPQDE